MSSVGLRRLPERGKAGRLPASPRRVGGDRLERAGQAEERQLAPRRADQLEPDRKAVGQPGRDAHARQARHIDRQRAGVGEVHRHRVLQLRTERPGDRRAGRGDQGVDPGSECRVEVGLDERPDLLGLQVERGVVARRERIRAEHDPALHLGAEGAARREVVGEHVAVATGMAEADPVVAGEVRRCLRRGNDVVGRQPVLRVRQADVDDLRARGADVESRPSRPATACRSIAASRASRANGPIWSSDDPNATIPYRLTLPYVGLSPTTPVMDAGWRMEPPVSVPRLSGTWPAATLAAEPPELPPGTRPRSHGFATGPYAECSVDEPIANSSMFSFPRITAPASRSRSVTCASYGEMYPARIREPAVHWP